MYSFDSIRLAQNPSYGSSPPFASSISNPILIRKHCLTGPMSFSVQAESIYKQGNHRYRPGYRSIPIPDNYTLLRRLRLISADTWINVIAHHRRISEIEVYDTRTCILEPRVPTMGSLKNISISLSANSLLIVDPRIDAG